MNRPVLTGSLALACFLAAACGVTPEKKDNEEKKPVAPAPRLVGRVASIPADRRFVLIQSYGGWSAPVDSILTTRGADDRTANLRVTGEALGQFAAADLQSGQVEIGDAVYLQPVIPMTAPSLGESTVEPLSAAPETAAEAENPTPENN